MDEKQELLAELLKLKLFLVQKLNSYTFTVMTEEMLRKVNDAIEKIEKE